MPVGGDAVLECRIRHGGDSILVWKNGTRVISVGDLQVGAVALMQQSAGATYYGGPFAVHGELSRIARGWVTNGIMTHTIFSLFWRIIK